MAEEGSVGTVVFAPWGDPANWVETRYVILDRRGREKARREAFTSLQPILESLERARAYIIAADTLAFNENPSPPKLEPPARELEDRVREYVGKKACLPRENYGVIVAPGVIRAKLRGSGITIDFRGAITDYYYKLLYDTIMVLFRDEPRGVALDLTHGINYMPHLAYKAVREAALLYLAREKLAGKLNSISLVVYNSDPVIPDPETRGKCGRSGEDPCSPSSPGECGRVMHEARINIVSKEVLRPALLAVEATTISLEEVGGYGSVLKPRARLGEKEAKIYNNIKYIDELLVDVKRIVKLYRYALVPELAAYIASRSHLCTRLGEAIRETVDVYSSLVHVKTSNKGEVIVERLASLGEGFRLLVYAWAIACSVEPRVDAGVGEPLLEEVFGLQGLYRGLDALWLPQEREKNKLIKCLRETASQLEGRERINLGELYSACNSGKESIHGEIRGCDVFKRDLLAHGGWHTLAITLESPTRDWRDRGEIRVGISERPVCKSGDGVKSFWEFLDTSL